MQEKLNNKIPSFYGQHFDNVFKNKKCCEKFKKTLKTRFYRKMKKKTFINVYYNYALINSGSDV